MTYLQKHSFHFRCRNGRRGSVIVLVVAVLALLAVIGTVYLVSSRTGRSAATAGSTAENLDQAQGAVNAQITHIIGDPVYDQDGIVGGRSITAPGPFGAMQARNFDMPEFNIVNPGYSVSDASLSPTLRDESWLASNLYRSPGNIPPYNSNVFNDLTLPQTRKSDNPAMPKFFSPSVFNPASGTYDLELRSLDVNHTATSAANFFRVVPDPWNNAQLPSFTSADGSIRNAGFQDDALVQMLPFSEANGTRYRFGIRIIDSSSMANLNVGNAIGFNSFGSLSNQQRSWLLNDTYYNSYWLDDRNATFNNDASPNMLNEFPSVGPNNPGRWGMFNLPVVPLTVPPASYSADYTWSQILFRLENPFRAGSNFPWDNQPNAVFDLTDELELRSYGNLGTSAGARVAELWPNTLGNGAGFNLNRGFYTTYSYSRDLRPLDTLTPYALILQAFPNPTPTPGLVWPPFPACVNVNPDVSAYTKWNTAAPAAAQEADELVAAAVNIATAMQLAGPGYFTLEQQDAFVANYLTFRWNSWQLSQNLNNPGYTLPAGPSFVDINGPCLRTVAGNVNYIVNYISSLHAIPGNAVYLGYAAQPFINEIAVQQVPPTPPSTSPTTIGECAIQLYNPYDVPLSLEDFELTWGSGASETHVFAATDYIPARGFYVLTKSTWAPGIDPKAQPTTPVMDANLSFPIGGSAVIYLKRKYLPRNGPVQYAAVDQYDASALLVDQKNPVAQYYALSRANNDDGTVNTPTSLKRWVAVIHSANAEQPIQTGQNKMGIPYPTNPPDAAALTATVPLYDRALDLYRAYGYTTAQAQVPQQQLLDNIADFNRIMRISNEIDSTTGLPIANGMLPSQLWSKASATGVGDHPFDAQVHFDFRGAPMLYSPGATAPTGYVPGDVNAVKLLQYLTLTDRVSDYTIDLGDNATAGGISKIRIPGRINVNTASPQVLGTLPVFSNTTGSVPNAQLLGCILAYRWRTTTTDARIPINCQPVTPVDFTSQTNYPGYGIRSMAELQIPILVFQEYAIAKTGPTLSYPTLFDRDQLWAQMFNSLTVRSDTFVAYAYLEGVRLNPRYAGPAIDNSIIWYQNVPSGGGPTITDDPNDTTHQLLRVARRRWVAIVDRSQANFSRYAPGSTTLDPRFAQPRIVAQKDLPH